MNKYQELHRKITEGLVHCCHEEYLGRHRFEDYDDFTFQHPHLAAMVKMLSSCVVGIVMDWEKGTAMHTAQNKEQIVSHHDTHCPKFSDESRPCDCGLSKPAKTEEDK